MVFIPKCTLVYTIKKGSASNTIFGKVAIHNDFSKADLYKIPNLKSVDEWKINDFLSGILETDKKLYFKNSESTYQSVVILEDSQ